MKATAPSRSVRRFRPARIHILSALLLASWSLALKVNADERVSSPLVRADSKAQLNSDEEFRLYGSDFMAQQFIQDARLPQNEPGGMFQTNFLYSPQMNAFKVPVTLPLPWGLGLFGSVSYLQRETQLSDRLARVAGVGDAVVGGSWSLSAAKRFYIQARGWRKFPTGDAEAEGRDYRLPLGTGSIDQGASAQAQARVFGKVFLTGGYGIRRNGIGTALDGDDGFDRVRRGDETLRVAGVVASAFDFMSLGIKWADIHQDDTRAVHADGSETPLDDAQSRSFLIPEVSAYFSPSTQITVQAHLPSGSRWPDVIGWKHSPTALVDMTLSSYF